MSTSHTPRLGIGLPVYNGGEYLAEALEALLGQTYSDFELIISDNASTDSTQEICLAFAARDSRIRYIRQPHNIGAIPNHNVVFAESRSELFKWASHDDLYARDLVERCVAALDEHPDVVLAHCWTAYIDSTDTVTDAIVYPLVTASDEVGVRFRSMLFDDGGDDDYGVIRSDLLRRIPPYDSYHRSDRTIIAELALNGPFHQVPEWLYFRRRHTNSIENSERTIRAKSVTWDPRRSSRWRHPVARLVLEYVLAYAAAIRRTPMTTADRVRCYRHLGSWLVSRTFRRTLHAGAFGRPWMSTIRADRTVVAPAEQLDRVGPLDQVVAGRQRHLS